MKDAKHYEIGVIIGRFQVHQLHQAHRTLIETVMKKHKKVILFLGVAPTLGTTRNPLDFTSRQRMIQDEYPELVIMALPDNRSDLSWSKNLDGRVKEVFPKGDAVIYGGRDSFIPHYHGKLPVQELEQNVFVSGTEIRKEVSEEIKASPLWRAGVIYQSYNKYPVSFQTVDIAAMSSDAKRILFAKKPGEEKLRFVGGFVDPTDISLEHAASREFREETGGAEITDFRYVSSFRVNDWRYRSEVDKIMTALFVGTYTFGTLTPSDDISSLEWVETLTFLTEGWIQANVTEEHWPLALALATYLNKNKSK